MDFETILSLDAVSHTGMSFSLDGKTLAFWYKSIPQHMAPCSSVALALIDLETGTRSTDVVRFEFEPLAMVMHEDGASVLILSAISSSQTTNEDEIDHYVLFKMSPSTLLSRQVLEIKGDPSLGTFSPDRCSIAVHSQRRIIFVDVETAESMFSIDIDVCTQWKNIISLYFSQEGRRLALLLDMSRLVILDLTQRHVMGQLPLPSPKAIWTKDYALSPDGLRVALRQGYRISLWSIADASELSPFSDSTDNKKLWVRALAISPDHHGTYLALATSDAMITVLDRASGTKVGRWDSRSVPAGHQGFVVFSPISALAISHKDTLLAIATKGPESVPSPPLSIHSLLDGTVLIRSGLFDPYRLTSYYAMAFTPGDDMIAFLKSSHRVELFEIDIEQSRVTCFSRHRYAVRAAGSPAMIYGTSGLAHATISAEGTLVPVSRIGKWEEHLRYQHRSLCARGDWLNRLPSTAFGTDFTAYFTFSKCWLQLGRIRLLYLPEEWRPSFVGNSNVDNMKSRAICTALIRGSTVIWGSQRDRLCTLSLDLSHSTLASLRSFHEASCSDCDLNTPLYADDHVDLLCVDPSTGVNWQCSRIMQEYQANLDDEVSDSDYDSDDSDLDKPNLGRDIEDCLDEEGQALWKDEQGMQDEEDDLTHEDWKVARCQRSERLDAALDRASQVRDDLDDDWDEENAALRKDRDDEMEEPGTSLMFPWEYQA